MRWFVLPLLLVILVVSSVAIGGPGPSEEVGEELAGVYRLQTPPVTYVSETLRLNQDRTFEYWFSSDVSNSDTRGTWDVVAPNLVELNSEALADLVTSATDSESKEISVVVRDPDGTGLPGVTVKLACADSPVRIGRTDLGGKLVFESCQVVRLSAALDGFTTTAAEFQNCTANHFSVTLRVHKPLIFENQLWYIHDGQIFKLKRPLTKEPDSD